MACQHQRSVPVFTPVSFPVCIWILMCPACGPWDTGTTGDPFALVSEWQVPEMVRES